MNEPANINIAVVPNFENHAAKLRGETFNILRCRPVVLESIDPDCGVWSQLDALLVDRESNHRLRLLISTAKKMKVPVIFLVDGILDWSYFWRHDHPAAHQTPFLPLLSDIVCPISRHQARFLSSLGMREKLSIVGIPRFDGIRGRFVQRRRTKPKILIATARNFGHNAEQKMQVRRALRALLHWFNENNTVAPVWRIDKNLAAELHVTPSFEASSTEALDGADGLISFPSTMLLEGMLAGIPTAQIDFRPHPLLVNTAWEIRCEEHIPGVIREMLYPPAEKLAYQDFCMEDELEPGSASERLADLLRAVARGKRRPNSTKETPLECNGRLDFMQVNSQLSAFSLSSIPSLQYELVAHQELLQELHSAGRLLDDAHSLTQGVFPEVLRRIVPGGTPLIGKTARMLRALDSHYRVKGSR